MTPTSSWTASATISSGVRLRLEYTIHAGVAQRVGDDLGAAIVTVEPGLAMRTFIGFLATAMSSVTSSA